MSTKSLVTLVLFLLAAASAHAAATRFIVIGCDGMSPDGIIKADTPVMDKMMKDGAWTLHARGVMPTSSSPNWASMIMGAGPEQHGVTSNDWERDKFEIAPIAKSDEGFFPTIFGLVRKQHPDAVIGSIYDWDGFGRLTEKKSIDLDKDCDGPTKTTEAAVAFIKEKKPTFLFVHLDHVDHVGHEVGHGTPEYYKSVEEADRYIGQILGAVSDAGLAEETVVLVTADHGGVKKGHGGATMAEIEIPWILAGPGVAKGREITAPVNTYDTAATVAHVLGVPMHEAWIAKPVLSAFE